MNSEGWKKRWSPAIGLWWQHGPGHTPAVDDAERLHAGRDGAGRLLLAAVTDHLDEIDTEAVLNALRQMQSTSGSHRGCFRWYWEEETIHDTNAAFFIGLPLLALNAVCRDDLSDGAARIIDEILEDLSVWFMADVEKRSFYYPNKYLGALVCAWLLAEGHNDSAATDTLGRLFQDASEYWLNSGWGWGEHLSDVYAPVCLRELALMLLLGERLPETVEHNCRALLHDLLAIEDAYDGVRVPAVRSYAFQEVPSHTNFRDTVGPADEVSEDLSGEWAAGIQQLLDDLGFHDLAGERSEPAADMSIPCYGGTCAKAHVRSDVRIGSLSRSPVIPHCEHATWGLAWQTFPVCAWRPGGGNGDFYSGPRWKTPNFAHIPQPPTTAPVTDAPR